MIELICTRGYGNGTFPGIIRYIVTRGYSLNFVPVGPPVKTELVVGPIRTKRTLVSGEIDGSQTVLNGRFFTKR